MWASASEMEPILERAVSETASPQPSNLPNRALPDTAASAVPSTPAVTLTPDRAEAHRSPRTASLLSSSNSLSGLLILLSWQVLSIALTGTGMFNQLLSDRGVNVPTSQNFINYALLSLFCVGMWVRQCRRPHDETPRSPSLGPPAAGISVVPTASSRATSETAPDAVSDSVLMPSMPSTGQDTLAGTARVDGIGSSLILTAPVPVLRAVRIREVNVVQSSAACPSPCPPSGVPASAACPSSFSSSSSVPHLHAQLPRVPISQASAYPRVFATVPVVAEVGAEHKPRPQPHYTQKLEDMRMRQASDGGNAVWARRAELSLCQTPIVSAWDAGAQQWGQQDCQTPLLSLVHDEIMAEAAPDIETATAVGADSASEEVNVSPVPPPHSPLYWFGPLQLHAPWWKYALVAIADVEGNFLLVKAYQYTTIASVQLLDCFGIPCVMALTYALYRRKFSVAQWIGVLFAMAGLGCLVASDSLSSRYASSSHSSSELALGDGLVLAGAALYAVSNVGQEYLVKQHNRLEFLGMTGVFGSIVSAVQIVVLERQQLSQTDWQNGPVLAYLVGYLGCLFSLYLLTPILLQKSSAVVMNLSFLTSDFWSLLVALRLFGAELNFLYFVAFTVIVVGILVYYMPAAMWEQLLERSREVFACRSDPHRFQPLPSNCAAPRSHGAGDGECFGP